MPIRHAAPVLALLVLVSAASALACTSFLLEDDGDLYYVHSLNHGAIPSVEGAVFINPRGLLKEGYSFAALFDPEDTSPPEVVWRSRYGSVTFSPLGKEMPDGGMNEAGLYVWEMGFDTEYPVAEQIPTLFQMQWMQYQLDNFTSVAEVLDHLDRVTLDGWGWHYFVADAEGNAAIIDFPDGRPEVFTGDSLPIPLCCNSSYPHAMRWLAELDAPGEPQYRREYHEIARFATGARRLRGFGGDDPVGYAFDTLQAMSENVRWSVVFDPKRSEVHFNTNLDDQVRRFRFTDADFAEGAPVLRLDIDTPGPGDVRNRFEVFDVEQDVALLPQILRLLKFDETSHATIARNIARRLSPQGEPPVPPAGEWTGTLTARSRGKQLEFPVTLRIGPDLEGSVECGAFAGTAAIRNAYWRGGLLRFVLETPETHDLLEFNLYRTRDGDAPVIKGYSSTWDWDNRQRAAIRLTQKQ